MEGLRRAIAGIGASAAANPVAPVSAEARAPARLLPPAHGCPPPAVVPHGGVTLAPAPARGAPLDPFSARGRVALLPLDAAVPRAVPPPARPPARAAVLPRPAARDAGLPARRPAQGPSPALQRALRVQRRHRVPWSLLDRERLGRAWERVVADHGAGGADLRLVGVYGPVAVGAVTSVALEGDGRLAVGTAPMSRATAAGDIALARLGPTGPLVRSDIPYRTVSESAGRSASIAPQRAGDIRRKL